MFANFFFSGSSTTGNPPVADFTGTPTAGSFPLTVTFTDSTTNTPTSWHWEKNDGTSGWADFDGTPTAQDPIEDFGDGVWSVRLTATNADGSNTKTRTDYIDATDVPANLEDLGNWLLLTRPATDVAASRLWQQLAKSTHATTSGNPVMVATMPPETLTSYDLTQADNIARLELGTASGFTSFKVIGSDPGAAALSGTSLPFSTIGSGSFHGFAWVFRPLAGDDVDGPIVSYFNVRVKIYADGGVEYAYGTNDISESHALGIGSWQLVQFFFDASAVQFGCRTNQNATNRVTGTPGSLWGNFQLLGYFCDPGVYIGSFGVRHANPSEADLDLVYNAGPNGDGSDWPQPLAVTAALLYSGEIVECAFLSNFTLGTGTPSVRIDGVNVSCVRYHQIASDKLWIRIPPASIVASSSSVVTVTLPIGLVSLGQVTNASCTNNVNTETLLPTAPPINAGDIEVGNNLGAPVYFTEQSYFSNAANLLSGFDTFGGTATYGTNGLPLTLTGGIGFLRAVMFIELNNPWQTGNYLLRTKGAGSASLYYDVNTAATLVSSGTAGGWNYREYSITAYNGYGLNVRFVPAITDFDLIFPGDWDAGTHLPLTVVDANWTTMYGAHSYMRCMSWLGVNDSNMRYSTDYLPSNYWKQQSVDIRPVTGTIISATSTTSLFIGLSSTCWLITHAIPGDPFHTGDTVLTGDTPWLIERVNATQYKALGNGVSTPTGSIIMSVYSGGIIEQLCLAANELNQDMWYNLPAMLDDTAVDAVADRVLAVLTSGIKFRLELSNECWNFGFKQTFYFSGLGRLNSTSGPIEYGRRAAQVHKRFLDKFTTAGRASDLVRLVAWQAFDSGTGHDVLDAYKAWCVANSYSFTAPHEYAIASYFGQSDPGGGSDTAATRFRDFICNGSDTPVALTAAGIIDLAVFNLLDPVAGSLAAATASANMVTDWNSANTASVRNVTYEGSQGITGAEFSFSGKTSGDGPNYAGSSGLDGAGLMMDMAFRRANRHPRMGRAQLGSIQQHLDLGYASWSQFGSLDQWSRYGYWSDTEYYNQPIGDGESNLADLDATVGSEACKLWAELQWIAAS